mmetsp:Transcript_102100/g.263996  ORF Transcript_102100/g.263996 Transcript_102100/m.263996 type:complete len:256 (+) Transcript_102100:78-845(+)
MNTLLSLALKAPGVSQHLRFSFDIAPDRLHDMVKCVDKGLAQIILDLGKLERGAADMRRVPDVDFNHAMQTSCDGSEGVFPSTRFGSDCSACDFVGSDHRVSVDPPSFHGEQHLHHMDDVVFPLTHLTELARATSSYRRVELIRAVPQRVQESRSDAVHVCPSSHVGRDIYPGVPDDTDHEAGIDQALPVQKSHQHHLDHVIFPRPALAAVTAARAPSYRQVRERDHVAVLPKWTPVIRPFGRPGFCTITRASST